VTIRPPSVHPRSSRIPLPHRDPHRSPGELYEQPHAESAHTRLWVYDPLGVDEGVPLSREVVQEARRANKIVWVRVVGQREPHVFQEIGDIFGIHQLALEDVMTDHQRPKTDNYDDHGLLVVRAPTCREELELEQISIILGEGFVISVQQHPEPWFDPVERRLRSKAAKLRTRSADYLVHALIDAALDSYLPVVERYRNRLEAVEDRIFDDPEDTTLFELHDIRHDLYAMRHVLSAIRDALADSVRGDETLFSDGLRVYLRDCEDHAAQLLDALDACVSMATSLVELRNSQLTQRMNEVMKWLSLISTIFIPLSFIVGVYGMNFDPDASAFNMPELRWRFGYLFALGLITATTLGFLWFFRYRGWIGGSRRRRVRRH
jgi:magnesium transporter